MNTWKKGIINRKNRENRKTRIKKMDHDEMENILNKIDKMSNSERVDFITKILDRAGIPDIGLYCCEKCDNVDSKGRFICECCNGKFCCGCIISGDYGFCDDCKENRQW
jgi:hypothetical protein